MFAMSTALHWARHCCASATCRKDTAAYRAGALPFVAAEARFRQGQARMGRVRESVLMHSIGRWALHPHIRNIQTSWVKMGIEGARGMPAKPAQRSRRAP